MHASYGKTDGFGLRRTSLFRASLDSLADDGDLSASATRRAPAPVSHCGGYTYCSKLAGMAIASKVPKSIPDRDRRLVHLT